MRTRLPLGGRLRDRLSLWRCTALLAVHVGGLRHYAALGTQVDDPLWRLLLLPLCRRNHRGELADVADQALGPALATLHSGCHPIEIAQLPIDQLMATLCH